MPSIAPMPAVAIAVQCRRTGRDVFLQCIVPPRRSPLILFILLILEILIQTSADSLEQDKLRRTLLTEREQ